MSINKFNFNMFDEIEFPTVILSTKFHKHLGVIETINQPSINSNFNLASAQEISFDIYKKLDGKECTLWDQIIDFKYVYIPEYQEYYSISVSIDENNNTIKHITAVSACEYELSSRKLYNFECNTENDILRDDYVPTIIYNADNPKASLLDRILHDKCPDYTIKHVDESVAKLQRTFSCDNTDIYSFFTSDIAKEVECVFVFDSVNRGIYVYDINTYGKYTNIHISSENYAELINIEGDTDNVFNCFRVSGGDDLITATMTNINPNGSQYIYNFSEDMLKDMPEDLVDKIIQYNDLYNSLSDDYKTYTDKIYELIDERLFLESEMMPNIPVVSTTAQNEANNIATQLKEVAVQNISVLSKVSADLAIKGMSEVIVDARYDVSIAESSLSSVIDGTYRRWTGKINVINIGDEEDTAVTTNLSIKVVGNNYEEYLYQKILKAIDKEDSTFYSIFEIEDINTFKNELKKYSLNRLKSFESSYNTCINILIENGVTDQNAVFYDVDLYKAMYLPYYSRILAIQEEMVIRENEIAVVDAEYETYDKLRHNIQEQLDFKNFIGDDLWVIFSHYRRESEYDNSNYISDGLNNAELIEKASELFNIAEKEIIKASELQYTISSTLNNILNIKEFNQFKDNIVLGNWINLVVDEKLYRLRLIGLSIDYGSPDKISIVFSNVIRIKNAVSDVESILSRARSMASSYNHVTKQAAQGEKASGNINEWLENGLNSALINISNNDNEEIIYDSHGLIARSYDDITNSYLPEQFKLTHNVMAFTNDNWLTTSLAIGKHKYTYYNEINKSFVEDEDYGVSAKFVNAGYIIGSQIISGDIYSSNYSPTSGTHIGLNDGTFSFAGGKLKYENGELVIGGYATNDSLKSYAKTTDLNNYASLEGLKNGSTIISGGCISTGNIVSANYNGTNGELNNTQGSILRLNDGVFSFAGGNLKYDGSTLLLKGNIMTSGGSIAGFGISQDGLAVSISETLPYTYTDDDITKMQEMIVGLRNITIQDLDKYDFDNDGAISAGDIVSVQRIKDNIDTNTRSSQLYLQTNKFKNTIVFFRQKMTESGEENIIGTTIDVQQVYSPTLHCGSFYCNKGWNGRFTLPNGNIVWVKSGIITSVDTPLISS